jgi:hypothetical protein
MLEAFRKSQRLAGQVHRPPQTNSKSRRHSRRETAVRFRCTGRKSKTPHEIFGAALPPFQPDPKHNTRSNQLRRAPAPFPNPYPPHSNEPNMTYRNISPRVSFLGNEARHVIARRLRANFSNHTSKPGAQLPIRESACGGPKQRLQPNDGFSVFRDEHGFFSGSLNPLLSMLVKFSNGDGLHHVSLPQRDIFSNL